MTDQRHHADSIDTRRQSMLAELQTSMVALHIKRRRRRRVVLSCLILILCSPALLLLRQPTSPTPAAPGGTIAQQPEATTPVMPDPLPVKTPTSARILVDAGATTSIPITARTTTSRIESVSATTVSRITSVYGSARVVRIDDRDLLDALAAIDRPAGLVEINGTMRLTVPVADNLLEVDEPTSQRPVTHTHEA
ncbi:MAG: hypothetical protein AAF432_03975 [Planctomycetota bacterium]